MRTTYSLQFYCRKSKASKNGYAPLELSLTINGKRVFIQLPRKEYPETFKKALESKRNNPIKEYVDEVRNQFNQVQLDLMRNNVPLSAESLKEYFRTGGIKTYTIEDAFTEYQEILRKRVGVTLTKGAYQKYVECFNIFFNFVDKTKELNTITPSVIEKFLIDCQSKYKESTTAGIMTKIKTVLIYCKDNNKLTINPFVNIKYSKGKKEIVYLTEEEVNKINDVELDNKSLSDVRDAFILQASTGLAYIDIFNLKKEDIQIAEDGTHYIVKNRHKTNVQFTTVILAKGVEVLKKHDYQLHIISNQKYNSYLKSIQTLTGITTNLTTHLARKTYATMLLNKGVRLEVVSRSLGHSSTAITQQAYATVLKNTVLEEVKAKFL